MTFLIQYDGRAGKSVRIERFGDVERHEAQAARLALELDLARRGIDHEVVLLDAKDEGTLRRTHAQYFESLEEMLARFQHSTDVLAVRERKDD